MRKFKLTKGKLSGKTVVFETDGETVRVICPRCGWSDWQTFFIDNFTEKDIHRECPDCDGVLIFDKR